MQMKCLVKHILFLCLTKNHVLCTIDVLFFLEWGGGGGVLGDTRSKCIEYYISCYQYHTNVIDMTPGIHLLANSSKELK